LIAGSELRSAGCVRQVNRPTANKTSKTITDAAAKNSGHASQLFIMFMGTL
jgi:hypothetical protein